MLRNLPLLPVAALLLLGCETRKPATTGATEAAGPAAPSAPPLPPPAPRPLAAADTVAPFAPLQLPPDSVAGLPTVRIDGQRYRVETSGVVDADRRLPLPPEADAATQAAVDSATAACVECGAGYDVVYTVRLLGLDGRPRFTTRLRKADFAAAMGADHVARSAPATPHVLRYLPQFNALALEVGFYLDGTDDGGAALLLLDARTGKPRRIVDAYWWGGGQGADALTPDGRTLLLGSYLLHADGRQVALERKGSTVAATRLINPTTALVVYDPSGHDGDGNKRPVRGDNAWLIDLSGRPLGRFHLGGLEAEVGYGLRAAYLRPTRTHYLYDYDAKALRLIPEAAPLRHRLLPLRQLAAFSPPRRPAEVRVGLYPDTGERLQLYVDTLSGAVRYQLAAPPSFE